MYMKIYWCLYAFKQVFITVFPNVFGCFVYLQKKIILNFVMEQNKEQRQIKLLKILAKGCKKHPAYRAIRKATERCEECVVVWQARVELNEMETKENI